MTELAISQPRTITPLAALSASTPKPAPLAEYHGVQTPAALEPLEQELAALALGAAVHDLGWLRRTAVRGEDRFRWLSGMVTNTVNDLGPRHGAWNLVLNAQGRILGDMTVWREENQLTLEMAADQQEKLVDHLEHFIIMDDVELARLGEERGAEETALGLTGPDADAVLQRMSLAPLAEPMTATEQEWNGMNLRIHRQFGTLAKHYVIWAPVATLGILWRALLTAGASPVGARAIEAFRIAEGIPTYGVDIVERDLAQETSQMRALHFSKGCYLGQEIVERIRSRGNVHRHLRQLELDGPIPAVGTELILAPAEGASEGESKPAGQLTSVAELPLEGGVRRFALGMIRGEAEALNKPLQYTVNGETGVARLLAAPPFL